MLDNDEIVHAIELRVFDLHAPIVGVLEYG